MTDFLRDNGIEGTGFCYHTASGYECVTGQFANNNTETEPFAGVKFFTRRVVGEDGFPYTEVGFVNVPNHDRAGLTSALKSCLRIGGFKEVLSIRDHHQDQSAFGEYVHPNPSMVAFRLNANFVNIARVVDIFGSLLPEASKEFVKAQEEVPNVLYESILSEMGPELELSPGGKDYAVTKAKELAFMLEKGYWRG